MIKVWNTEVFKRAYDGKFSLSVYVVDPTLSQEDLRDFERRDLPLPWRWIVQDVFDNEADALAAEKALRNGVAA